VFPGPISSSFWKPASCPIIRPVAIVASTSRIWLPIRNARDGERKAALDRIAKEAFESGLYDRTGMPEGGEDE